MKQTFIDVYQYLHTPPQMQRYPVGTLLLAPVFAVLIAYPYFSITANLFHGDLFGSLWDYGEAVQTAVQISPLSIETTRWLFPYLWPLGIGGLVAALFAAVMWRRANARQTQRVFRAYGIVASAAIIGALVGGLIGANTPPPTPNPQFAQFLRESGISEGSTGNNTHYIMDSVGTGTRIGIGLGILLGAWFLAVSPPPKPRKRNNTDAPNPPPDSDSGFIRT